MTLMNRKLNRKVDTMFLMTGFKWFYTSSRIIKEAASMGGSVIGLVPESCQPEAQRKIPEISAMFPKQRPSPQRTRRSPR